jgi:hypothetical protein
MFAFELVLTQAANGQELRWHYRVYRDNATHNIFALINF